MNRFITRKKDKNKYEYFLNKKLIKNIDLINQIKNIYIPPAYKNVKIYLQNNLLATGIDKAGRKQYIYSNKMIEKRELKKKNQLLKISDSILKIKKKIKNDLTKDNFDKNKVIALMIKIMNLCNFRGGSKKYEEKYKSFGLTTLHKKHIKIETNQLKIDFSGKKGVQNSCVIKNEKIQNLIKKLYNSNKNSPYLFELNINNKKIDFSLTDINNYLSEFNITCKDLRTWNANIIFLKNISHNLDQLNSQILDEKETKKLLRESIKNTSILLHNTPIVCKNSYILKNIIDQIQNNNFINDLKYNKINYEKFLKISIKKYN